jgi:hypothetical protein
VAWLFVDSAGIIEEYSEELSRSVRAYRVDERELATERKVAF